MILLFWFDYASVKVGTALPWDLVRIKSDLDDDLQILRNNVEKADFDASIMNQMKMRD